MLKLMKCLIHEIRMWLWKTALRAFGVTAHPGSLLAQDCHSSRGSGTLWACGPLPRPFTTSSRRSPSTR